MKDLKGKNVLITGGASGIGKIMVRLMLERNANVIIWDINQENINITLSEFSNLGNLYSYIVDVSNIEQVEKTAKNVKQQIGTIDVLINNAGIVVGEYFHHHSITDILNTMEINAIAPMIITNVFLKDMLVQNSGHICNISSSAGIISNPKMSVYAASKWSLIGWSDSLRLEMKKMKKNIHVTTIMPYYIKTGMFAGVKSKLSMLEPETTAHKIIKAIERDKKMLTIPSYIYRWTRFGQAILSFNIFDWIAGNVLGIYNTMDQFTGRKNKTKTYKK